MPSYRITIAYDGTSFVGWQRQASGQSIQGLLEDALGELDGDNVTVIGAGRTDAGVHALGQVAGFSLRRTIAPEALVRAINARLPPAVRLLDAAETAPAFHARYLARTKTYRYRVVNGDVHSPFERAYAWHVREPLEVHTMDAAARLLEGAHDFAAFRAAGSRTRTTHRTVRSSRVRVEGNGSRDLSGERWFRLITYEIAGDGFLRHMVRTIVGSLVEIGRGRRDVDWMREVLASRDRTKAGPTAPASGLFLLRVDYNTADVP